MIYAAIIAVCLDAELTQCYVKIFPNLFKDERQCQNIVAEGLKAQEYRNPYAYYGYCVKFPMGDNA